MGEPMTFDEITEARKVLFSKGGIFLVFDGKLGQMIPASPEHKADADEYNRLAEIHAGMNRHG